ncbi:acyl-CoA dehydrogenase family protein [Micromonospora sp. URMC 106]|uniref:acyl-CoA dehydrogenase family protein n=1 Tax=Micromonospora sp. URMC 106 TaxID=3423408 RepID=UPI003F1C1EA1
MTSTSPVSRYLRDHVPIVDSFRSFVARELVPMARELGVDEPAAISPDDRRLVRRRSADLGFYAGDYPESVGGQDMPFTAKLMMHEYAEASGCPLAPTALCNAEGPSWLLLTGDPQRDDRHLRPLVTARATRCLALTEPDGGSDAFALATTASRKEGGWLLRGRKAFVSNADQADLTLVVARIDTDPPRRSPGIFAVPAGTAGLVVGQRFDGMSGEPVFELLLDDVWVDESALVGAADADAPDWRSAEALARGRLLVAAQCNGMAARALALGVEVARTRSSFGRRIGEHQHVQEHVVASRLALESARLLTAAAAQHFDEGDDVVEFAALAKLAASEAACEVVNRMLQVHGAVGWIRGHPLEYLYRQVRAMTIIEGTSEVQKVIIANSMGLG